MNNTTQNSILDELKPFMYNLSHIKSTTNTNVNTNITTNTNATTNVKTNTTATTNVNTNITATTNVKTTNPIKDELFYIFNNVDNLVMEKEVKIRYVEKLNLPQSKEILKSHGIKLTTKMLETIELNLVHQPFITMETFMILCYLEDIEFILKYDKFYHMYKKEKEDINTPILTIIKNGHNLYTHTQESAIINNYILVEGIQPFKLKSASAYKVSELENICLVLNLTLEQGVKKTKTTLYELLDKYFTN